MLINRLTVFLGLMGALGGVAKALDVFELLHDSLDAAEECWQKNNISSGESIRFYFDFAKNGLNETLELKYKCYFKCMMEELLEKWLNVQGIIDLAQMNLTTGAEEYMAKCMDQADEEPCAYAFKLIICANEADDLNLDNTSEEYEEYEEYEETSGEEPLELTTETGP